jgi:hypothetical protein
MVICNCGREFKSQKSLNSHARFCEKYIKKESKTKYFENGSYFCECGKKFKKSQSLNAHFSHCLIHRKGKKPIDRFEGVRNWSKGKTKETHNGILEASKKNSIIMKGKKMSQETCNKLSLKRIEYLNISPHIKWYTVNNGKKDIKVQGKWEKNVALWLNNNNIKWDRKTLKYDNTRRYTPDFYLPEQDIYIEVKGWLREYDIIKMRKTINQNKINIKILDKLLYNKLSSITLNDLKDLNDLI